MNNEDNDKQHYYDTDYVESLFMTVKATMTEHYLTASPMHRTLEHMMTAEDDGAGDGGCDDFNKDL